MKGKVKRKQKQQAASNTFVNTKSDFKIQSIVPNTIKNQSHKKILFIINWTSLFTYPQLLRGGIDHFWKLIKNHMILLVVILLMEEILHQWIGSLPHFLQGILRFLHLRWCSISSINRIAPNLNQRHGELKGHWLNLLNWPVEQP